MRAAAASAAAVLSQQPITLDDLLENGQGVGRAGGMVAFVTGGLPGETAHIAIDAVKRKYVSAHVTSIEKPSPDRVQPFCPVFPTCGGCQTQHLAYHAQLAWKRRLVGEALARLGGLRDIAIEETIASPQLDRAHGYRNKASLVTHFSGGRMRLGFYAARTHRVVPIEGCPVLIPRLDRTVRALTAYAAEAPQPFSQSKHVVARASATSDDLVLSFNGAKPNKALGALADDIRNHAPGMTGLACSWELENDNAIFGSRIATVWGSPTLEETVAGAHLRFGIASFFQINTAVLELIAQRVVAELTGASRVVDLYCGVGTFGVILGLRGISTTGVESFKPAVDEAAANASQNGVLNAAFEHATAAEAVSGERGRTLLARTDAVILDPPRKGCEPAVLHGLADNAVPRILYVSCNPATLARDAKILVERGYGIERVTPYDMFPHTGHVEIVATFRKT
jgi:23S rRNA (uracil1939-C5)-methyltransferase